ncbi:MAG: flagellar basal body L-ring protein FlgH [Parvularcula sp.]
MRSRLFLLLTALGMAACASRPAPVPPAQAMRVPDLPFEATEPVSPTPSLWNQEPQSLFGNRRARHVGDILTVIVEVDENAQMQNSLDRSRSNQDDLTVGALFGLPEYAAGTLPNGATLNPAVQVTRNAQAKGSGTISRQEKITLRLAAQVVQTLPNGHLVIEGTQRIRVNNEARDLRLRGIVRPDDITRDNTIKHDKVASADILYTGHGQIAQTTGPRRGSRLLDILIPF